MAMMPVVVGVDGSEESLRAVEWAAQAAQRHGAPLRLVSAPVMPPRMRAHGGVPQTVADEMYGESVRALSEAVTRAEEVSSRLLIDASPLAKAFGRRLGPVVAIARGPLAQVGAPFMEQQAGRETRGTAPQTGKYSVPDSIAYSQTVNAIFVLK